MHQCFIQVIGPFETGVDIIAALKEEYVFNEIIKMGIQTKPGNKFSINYRTVEMGKTGVYELNNVDINSLVFLQDENELTIIDFIVE